MGDVVNMSNKKDSERKARQDIERCIKNLPILCEYYLARAEVQRKVYNKAIEEGFTPEQALEIVKDGVV